MELLIGLALGLALRLAYAWYGHNYDSIPTTVDGYETIALSLLERGEYSIIPGVPTSMREPTYPLFISAVYWVLGGRRPWAVLALQCALGVGTAWLAGRLGRRLFGPKVGRGAFWAYLFYPPSIYYSAYFFRETVSVFLLSALAWFSTFWAAPQRDSKAVSRTLASGLAAGALALSNSAILPATMLAGLALPAAAPAGSKLRRAILYWAPLALGLLFWTGRNWSVHHALVAGSTHGGEEFYQALIVPPSDLGTGRQTEILAADPAWLEAVTLPEVERNARLTAASLSFIARNPGVYAGRVLARIVKFWRLWPYKRRYHHSFALLVAVSLLSDGWIIPLGLCGLWLFRARWRQAPALPAAILGLTLVYGAVHAVIRYRTPLMPGVLVVAIAAGYELRRRISGSQSAVWEPG